MSVHALVWMLGIVMVSLLTSCSVTAVQDGYATIPGGEYVLGEVNHLINPKRKVTVAPYAISIHEVTNQQFEAFVLATGHITLAEKRHDAMVFYPGLGEFRWHQDSTAWWRYPNGVSRGDISDKMTHPVTCISYLDVLAYCKWAGVRLPTLDEWEVAARAGARSRYYWGNKPGKMAAHANIWHGKDHLLPDTADAWLRTSPVGTFAPNPHGLYDVYGNVFEFCDGMPAFLQGKPDIACARGGSWWCSFASCSYFNNTDIGDVRVYASFSNQGFRVVQ